MAEITKSPVALLKCKKKRCNNFKFAHDDSWEKVVDKNTISYFAKKARNKEFVVYRVNCPDCTPREVSIHSELQPGDIVEESSKKCEQT